MTVTMQSWFCTDCKHTAISEVQPQCPTDGDTMRVIDLVKQRQQNGGK
jgi:hypothetical protein